MTLSSFLKLSFNSKPKSSLSTLSQISCTFSLLFILNVSISPAFADHANTSPQQATPQEERPTGQLKFSHLSPNDGLSSSTVFNINQDDQGYLWIATEDGLNRFDGTDFQLYRHDTNNPNSISDNVVRKIFIDNNNTVWVGTQNGLNRYNRELDNFDTFYHVKEDNNSIKDNTLVVSEVP